MSKPLQEIKERLGKPYDDFEFLLNCFAEVLEENNETELATHIPWITEEDPDFTEDNLRKILHLYSISFQLLNLAEVNGAVQARRRKTEASGLHSVNGLWANVLRDLKERGVDPEQIAEQFPHIEAEPVLTAHPTEAKRPVVLALYRDLYLLLVRRENSMYTTYEREGIRHDIKRILHKLWYIGEIFIEKPAVESELENVLHYFYKVFPEVVPFLDFKLKQAWEDTGFDPDLIESWKSLPTVTFGNWVGGDRDGHPLVNSGMTEHTLKEFRLHALRLVIGQMDELSGKLSIYIEGHALHPEFRKRLESLDPAYADTQKEPFKHYIRLLKGKLPVVERSGGGVDLKDTPDSYRNSSELSQDIALLETALDHIGARSLVQYDVQKVLRHLDVFGFHLARLDVRQNSQYFEEALMEIIKTALPERYGELSGDREALKAFILEELTHNRPFLARAAYLESETAREAVRTFQALARHFEKYSFRALGSLIVSMTRSAVDLLMVYLFAREAGLTRYTSDGMVCPLPVVPLFETIDDLKRSPGMMDEFMNHPLTQRSIRYMQEAREWQRPVQDVMVGYSDSNKDGGILSSAWRLHEAQMNLAETGRKHGIAIRFFHGKGGTISRGAGPTHWFLKSLPEGSLDGLIRMTEQGETIERKYANKGNATYNLELFLAGTAHQTVLNRIERPGQDPLRLELFEYLARESFQAFNRLTTHECFIPFYEQATPIDVIESSKIGSRPARRKGKRTLDDLRAIPWVFSWTQSRMHISSWFGVGTTLDKMRREEKEKYDHLKKLVKSDNFIRYVLTNIDTSLAATDEEIMKLYAGMVEDRRVRDEILSILLEELKLTRSTMLELLEKPISERRVNHYYSTNFRAAALIHLHRKQVDLIKEWRKAGESGKEERAEQLLQNLLRSVNAIANAMGTTG